ncbi:MAG TPA: hypothetical protein VJH23_02775 [archaeon]|nr:hypothetical protein [archaeon]
MAAKPSKKLVETGALAAPRKNFWILALCGMVLYTLFALILPFWTENNLMAWDSAGQYFAAWYQSEYLFPRIVGWNPFFFLGYAQNQFYPPLYSYVSALLAQVMPLEAAFKLVLVVVLLATPFSFFYFARSFGFSKNRSSAVAVCMFALLFIFPQDYFGGNMHATFNVGLYPHALGLALFFLYFGSLHRAVGSKKILLPTILLSAMALTNVATGLAGTVLLAAYAANNLHKKENLKALAKHFALVFALTAFWVLPAAAKLAWTNVLRIGSAESYSAILVLAVAYFAYVLFMGKSAFRPIALFGIGISAMVFLFGALNVPLHPYRFFMFIVLLIPIALFSIPSKENDWIYVVAVAVCVPLILLSPNLHPEGPTGIEANAIAEKIEGRVMVLAPLNAESSPHLLQHSLPMQNGFHSLRGLFVESSRNASFVFDVEKELFRNSSLQWGVISHREFLPQNWEDISGILKRQLDLFGVKYAIVPQSALEGEKLQEIAKYDKYFGDEPVPTGYTYNLMKVGDSNLFEVLDYKPRLVSHSGWERASAQWFLSDDIANGVLVDEEVPGYVGSGTETVKVLEMSPTLERIKFFVDSQKPVPVLIKISDFPNWRAYESGAPVKIYRASPYLMLVYGKGEMELKYEQLLVDLASGFISFIGLGILLILMKKELGVDKIGT